MSEILLWDIPTAHHFAKEEAHTQRLPEFLGSYGFLDYGEHSPAPFPYLRPTLHIETNTPDTSPFGFHLANPSKDFHQNQHDYMGLLRHGLLVQEEIQPSLCSFFPNQVFYEDFPNLTPPQSSPFESPAESHSLSPESHAHSFKQSYTVNSGIQQLEQMSPVSPIITFEHRLPARSLKDRVKSLDSHSQRLFRTCGSNSTIQSAALDIFESVEFKEKLPITSESAEPLLEKIKYTSSADGKGKRGAPQFYKCLWGSCGEKMSRRLHALEHIMNHVGNRSHICEHCGKGFIRKNELKKHSPCKAFRKKLACANRGPGTTRAQPDFFPNTPCYSDPNTKNDSPSCPGNAVTSSLPRLAPLSICPPKQAALALAAGTLSAQEAADNEESALSLPW